MVQAQTNGGKVCFPKEIAFEAFVWTSNYGSFQSLLANFVKTIGKARTNCWGNRSVFLVKLVCSYSEITTIYMYSIVIGIVRLSANVAMKRRD